MKKIVLITSAILLTLCIFIACDNGVAFVNDIKPLPKATDGDTYVPVYVTALDADKFEGELDPELKYTFSPNPLPAGISFSGVLTREPGETEGGSPYVISQGTLKLVGDNADKHILIFTGAKFNIFQKGSISIRAKNMSKFKGDPDPDFDESTYVVSPSMEALAGQGLTLNVVLSRESGEDIGSYPISVNYTLTGEHASEWVVNRVGATFYIAAEDEIIVTAPTLEKNYKDSDPVFHVSTTPALPAGLTLVGGPSREHEGVPEGEVVGDYVINQGSLAFHPAEPDDAEGHKTGRASNGKVYKLIFHPGSLKINKRPVAVTAESYVVLKDDPMPGTFAYRNNENLPAAAFSGALVCDASNTHTTGEFPISKGSLALTDVWIDAGHHEKGTYIQNHEITFVPGVLNVTNNIPIEVYANVQTKVYGTADPYLSYSYTPALPAGLSLAGNLSRAAGNDVNTYPINQGDLHLEGNEANLYVLHFTGADLTITQKPVVIKSKDGLKKTYNKVPVADPVLDFDCYEPGDGVNLGPGIPELNNNKASAFGDTTLERTSGNNAGSYAINEGTLALKGKYNDNYEIVSWNLGQFEVEQCPVLVSIYPTSKVRDDDDPEFNYAVTPSNLMDVDNWKTTVFKGSFTRDAGEAEGLYTIRQRTDQEEGKTDATKKVQLIGEYATNYKITSIQTGTFHITPPGPVHISDPVKYMKPIITELHDKYVVNDESATFRKAPGPLKRDPETGKYPANIVGETFLGSFAYWYDSNDNTVYYYYGGDVYLYGDCHNLFEGCYKYRTMDMTGFNTQYVNNMYQMFFLCYNVKKLDLSGWSFNEEGFNEFSMANMFDRCEMLEEIKFNKDGVDMSKVTHMGWIFAHNFFMTPTNLRAIIAQWKVKLDPNGGNDDSNINPLFLSNEKDGGERTPEGANRIVSNDMIADAPDGILSSTIKQKYIKDRDIPSSHGYKEAGGPPSKAFGNDVEETTKAYVTKDGISLYLGIHINHVRGQRLNRVPNSTRPDP